MDSKKFARAIKTSCEDSELKIVGLTALNKKLRVKVLIDNSSEGKELLDYRNRVFPTRKGKLTVFFEKKRT